MPNNDVWNPPVEGASLHITSEVDLNMPLPMSAGSVPGAELSVNNPIGLISGVFSPLAANALAATTAPNANTANNTKTNGLNRLIQTHPFNHNTKQPTKPPAKPTHKQQDRPPNQATSHHADPND
ncbi:MAG TPA: hypothetical protein VK778_10990 [Solirubrobacteraceae bacterium]|nr:hypothetical protein [Solirubrobacteraceae bacterium]